MSCEGAAALAERRVTLFRNGTNVEGKVMLVPETFEEFLEKVSEKLSIPARKVYTQFGGVIDDVDLLREDDILYVSVGEPFIRLAANSPEPIAAHIPVSISSDEIGALTCDEWVTLNVGGRYFTTTRSTLTTKEPESMLARMFCKEDSHMWANSVDSNGAYLIDRSPAYFEPILNYLRHGELVIDKNVNPQGVLEEARFFGIESLIHMLEVRIEDEKPATDLTPITRREFVLKLMTTPSNCELRCQGLNFSNANLSKLDLRYVNFKYATLRRANLSGANLSYCNFERADMTGAKLDAANLLGAKMLCVTLEGASLQVSVRRREPGIKRKHWNCRGRGVTPNFRAKLFSLQGSIVACVGMCFSSAVLFHMCNVSQT